VSLAIEALEEIVRFRIDKTTFNFETLCFGPCIAFANRPVLVSGSISQTFLITPARIILGWCPGL
jgi:hypothetical protein